MSFKSFRLGLPKIRKCDFREGGTHYKYKVGRDHVGWWSVTPNLWEAIRVWFSWYL